MVTADAFGQPNAVHNEGGDQDDPNLDGDATGEDNAPEARNQWAGDVQLVPGHDTILELLSIYLNPRNNGSMQHWRHFSSIEVAVNDGSPVVKQ